MSIQSDFYYSHSTLLSHLHRFSQLFRPPGISADQLRNMNILVANAFANQVIRYNEVPREVENILRRTWHLLELPQCRLQVAIQHLVTALQDVEENDSEQSIEIDDQDQEPDGHIQHENIIENG